jgi:hypothetical protein
MGNVTINGDLTGTAVGGLVGGAANLTTAGAIPYVSSAGVLNQDATALFWDAANDRLGIGTNAPQVPIHVLGSGTRAIRVQSTDGQAYFSIIGGTFGQIQNTTGDFFLTNSAATGSLVFRTNETERARIAWGTGNLLIGTATDDTTNKLQVSGNVKFGANGWITIRDAGGGNGSLASSNVMALDAATMLFRNAAGTTEHARFGSFGSLLIGTTTDSNLFRVDVSGSGSSGTLRVYDQTPTTGVTRAVIRAGAGQSAASLTEWQNSSGTQLALISSVGAVRSDNFVTLNSDNWNVNAGNMSFASTRMVAWSNSSTDSYGTKDLGIYRNAAGVLEVNSGTTGTYRDLILRRSQHNGVTVAALPAAAAGNAGSIQYVTDANATTIGSTVVGGGANKVMVWSDGAAWKIFAS